MAKSHKSEIVEDDFVPTMHYFLKWTFQTLDPEFIKMTFRGKSIEDGCEELLYDLVAKIRGNRGPDAPITGRDYSAIMDSVAALSLRIRHGESAVSETVSSTLLHHNYKPPRRATRSDLLKAGANICCEKCFRLQCMRCSQIWQPTSKRGNYWICPNGCNRPD